jgi:hypothetical protein
MYELIAGGYMLDNRVGIEEALLNVLAETTPVQATVGNHDTRVFRPRERLSELATWLYDDCPCIQSIKSTLVLLSGTR